MKKMKKRISKKGFTLVELLVVIAILAVLATVSVVGYLGFTKKAKISNDISLTTQMNTILQAEEAGGETFDTPHDAVEALKNGGLDISKLTPTTNDYSYVYDLKQNRFFLLDDQHQKVAPSNQDITIDNVQLYAFVGSQSETESGYWKEKNFSFYLKDNFSFTSTVSTGDENQAYKKIFGYDGTLIQNEVKLAQTGTITVEGVGIDTGSNKNVGVTFTGEVKSDIVIRTTGDQSSVSITTTKSNDTSSSEASVSVYGFANKVEVKEEGSSNTSTTVNVAGSCNDLTVTSGKVEVEETAIVAKAKVGDNANVNNSGYIGEAKKADGTTELDNNKISGKKVGGNYEISTLAQLEAFRDTVNAGNDFSTFNESNQKIVELKSDITLKNGWTPIGEGYRKVKDVSDSKNGGTFFKGTFDGGNHTISNLNNIGYTPTDSRLYKDKENGSASDKAYCYGLFALVDDATIKDLILTNVNINNSNYTGAEMDSVAALVGYATGNASISNITVSGSITANDAAGGIVGRWYDFGSNTTIIGCTNNATITALKSDTSTNTKAAGIVGYVSLSNYDDFRENMSSDFPKTFTVKGCTNKGNIKSTCWADGLATIDEKYKTKTGDAETIYVNLVKGNVIKNEGSTNTGTLTQTKDSQDSKRNTVKNCLGKTN